ncbi:uncharacterized protein LOC115626289 [Scaptodrosophila lebanonensis]|uniref:Uncharacterized protein LOC115626289 n=1 Tax=Drosophila lebanonensis TaxID=7225 RepID=A0A6J2TQS8_DROLE|nr:uncharacterized protein LOC115626289 [Scaptodrosophila lebanonensis]
MIRLATKKSLITILIIAAFLPLQSYAAESRSSIISRLTKNLMLLVGQAGYVIESVGKVGEDIGAGIINTTTGILGVYQGIGRVFSIFSNGNKEVEKALWREVGKYCGYGQPDCMVDLIFGRKGCANPMYCPPGSG